ncbi:hypothetical protein D7B24_004534 [Verticillium nonalfalfae]|uniref:lytic cellulose monooxygenase (C4-dehydrogenating) n=1 Tax=Verticillium nonalfalfae TaxID=1051616 RepID=A0A3M9XVZ9_9PEZI|nr:uncharacterized protein D7B24_004534 [Verticillium nonalfalfae]RNJ52055.1 hypothetical protein D7B24_004534 [Verticillium nonalfalfae]
MKVSAFVLAVVAQVASAHYFFDTNIINGNSQPSFKYVQTFTRATKYNPIKFSSNPAADIRDGSFADGPGLVYMSRAPGDNVKAYDGSGDWFKIFEEGVCTSSSDFTKKAWCTWGRNWIAAKVPKNTPNGEYLFRAEHIGVHRSHINQPEHYVSCVQIKVVNGGNGSPGPLVKFPGTYNATDAYADFSIYGGHETFPFPGPAVWNGVSGGSRIRC